MKYREVRIAIVRQIMEFACLLLNFVGGIPRRRQQIRSFVRRAVRSIRMKPLIERSLEVI